MVDRFRARWRSLWPSRGRHEDVRLSALLDDELDVDEALEVTRHLADCSRCLQELDAIRAARQALRGLPSVVPPSELYTQVLAEPPAGVPRARTRRRIVSVAVVSAGLIGVAAFLVGNDEPGTIAPPVDVFVVDHVARLDGGPIVHPFHLSR
ncbi:MAG TPA: zf-HC2 domain-containing protein [Nitriliruptorales bacterium]|nr:zf-HC2 domain-containing protein [Nitriliruptorales bacterium]